MFDCGDGPPIVARYADCETQRRASFKKNIRFTRHVFDSEIRCTRPRLFVDLAQLRERENLITAAICQDRSIPIHELVQAAEMFDHIDARSLR